jgi:pimeloyl-ACP methyl ester carboxylesterase
LTFSGILRSMPGATSRQRLLLRVALYGGAFFVALPAVFAFILTQPHRARVSDHPPPRYTEVRLVSDGLRLRAWLSRGDRNRAAVIIVHGLGDTLESYQEHAQPFIDRGHIVLLLDLRGHGGSEGTYTTLGGRESEDVRAAMRYLEAKGLAEDGFVLLGHSMGAVAVLLAAADRTDVRAVIAEAPYDTYRNTVAHHARILYGLPSWVPLIPLSIQGAEWRAGFDADDIDAVAAASRIQAPLLAIVDGDDERMPEPVVRRIVDAHSGSHKLWVASGVGHVGAIYHPDWKTVVLGFLEDHADSSARANPSASFAETGTPPNRAP